jgi:DNA processing protein
VKEDDLLYQIAITQISNVGPRIAKQLIGQCGSAKEVFNESMKALSKLSGCNVELARSIKNFTDFSLAEKEINFIQKHRIETRFFQDGNYPFRLKFCNDGPLLLFGKGNIDWNPKRALSIVGTRRATVYGRTECRSIVEGLQSSNLTIVSGMAYGIDICAHRAAVKNNVATVAVVAHGLDRLYPSVHRETLVEMMDKGGVITEFLSGTIPDRENFPKRNRIIAGFSDATLVIESGAKGGSMITADIAASYNRDVFAIPGNNGSPMSQGCNYLIHCQKAGLIRGAADIKKIMNWVDKKRKTTVQTALFVDLNEEEKKLVSYLHHSGAVGIDDICLNIDFPMSKTSVILLNLEFKGMILSLPGKVYQLV